MSGLPGSGKSTLSQFIAKKYKALYLRIDTIEQGLIDLCNFNVEGEGYRLSYRIAKDNLKLGLNVVADSCNPITLTRSEWENVAETSNAFFVNIEIICSNESEHRERIQTRISDIENLKLPTWQDVQNREYHQWQNQRIVIDTAKKSVEESKDELDKEIKHYLNKVFLQ